MLRWPGRVGGGARKAASAVARRLGAPAALAAPARGSTEEPARCSAEEPAGLCEPLSLGGWRMLSSRTAHLSMTVNARRAALFSTGRTRTLSQRDAHARALCVSLRGSVADRILGCVCKISSSSSSSSSGSLSSSVNISGYNWSTRYEGNGIVAATRCNLWHTRCERGLGAMTSAVVATTRGPSTRAVDASRGCAVRK